MIVVATGEEVVVHGTLSLSLTTSLDIYCSSHLKDILAQSHRPQDSLLAVYGDYDTCRKRYRVQSISTKMTWYMNLDKFTLRWFRKTLLDGVVVKLISDQQYIYP